MFHTLLNIYWFIYLLIYLFMNCSLDTEGGMTKIHIKKKEINNINNKK